MKHDILVIGNGVVGCSVAIAISLEDPTLRIGVVGKSTRPGGASPAAGAMHGCFGEITTGLLHSKFGRHKLRLDIQARGMWPNWLALLNEKLAARDRVYSNNGTFVVVNTKSGFMEDRNYETIRQQLLEHGEPWEDVDPLAIDGLSPSADARAVRALYIPGEGSIDSGRLLRALELYIEGAANIEAIDQVAASLVIEGQRIVGVTNEAGETLPANTIVVAAGVGSQLLIDSVPELSYRIPRVFPGEGTSVLFEVPQKRAIHKVIRTPNRSFACGLHVVPREQNLLYAGATNNTSIEPATRPLAMDMYFLMNCAIEQIDQEFYGARAVRWSTGNRPIPIDTMPLIGPVSLEGLWILTGTYRDGLHQSPLLAKHLACEITGKPGMFDNPFAPERKPLSIFTREEAIEETLTHYSAVGSEHLWQIPKIGWHNTLPRHFETAIRSIYEDLDTPFVLPPEFVSIIDNDRTKMLPFFRNYYEKVRQSW